MTKKLLGTREQKEIKLRTLEQKLCLGNREHQNRKNAFREQRNARKMLLGIREHGPPVGGPRYSTETDDPRGKPELFSHLKKIKYSRNFCSKYMFNGNMRTIENS